MVFTTRFGMIVVDLCLVVVVVWSWSRSADDDDDVDDDGSDVVVVFEVLEIGVETVDDNAEFVFESDDIDDLNEGVAESCCN